MPKGETSRVVSGFRYSPDRFTTVSYAKSNRYVSDYQVRPLYGYIYQSVLYIIIDPPIPVPCVRLYALHLSPPILRPPVHPCLNSPVRPYYIRWLLRRSFLIAVGIRPFRLFTIRIPYIWYPVCGKV